MTNNNDRQYYFSIIVTVASAYTNESKVNVNAVSSNFINGRYGHNDRLLIYRPCYEVFHTYLAADYFKEMSPEG